MTTQTYPPKVQKLVDMLRQPPQYGGMPWERITVEPRPMSGSTGTQWIITAQKYPDGNVFVHQTLSLYVFTRGPRPPLWEGDTYRSRSSERFSGGYLRAFQHDVRIRTWRDARRECRS